MTDKIATWIAAGTLLLAAPAFAGSLEEPVVEPVTEAPVMTTSEWEGFYAGAFGRENFTGPTGVDVGFGGFAGYNMDMGNGFILGAEGTLEFDPAQPSPPFGGSVWGAGSDWTGTANVRVGKDFGRTLAFAKAGVGYTSRGFSVWDVGAGLDFKVMDDWFVRGEYMRVDPIPAGPVTRNNINLGVGYRF